MTQTRTLPVRKWFVRIEPLFDKAAALEAWRLLVKAQGWSIVGEPELTWDGGANPGVIGRVVEYPGLTVKRDAHSITIPA